MNMCKVMVIVAHPDDEVLGMGGTISKLCEEGHEVHVLYATGGETSCGFSRHPQTSDVARILGVHSTIFLNLPDQKLDTISQSDLNNMIQSRVELVKPDIVYTHAKEDLNIDHRVIHDSVMVSCRPTGGVKELYTFCVSQWDFGEFGNFVPNTFVTIDYDKKIEAMCVYSSEVKGSPHPMSIDNIKYRDIHNGSKFCKWQVEEFKQVFRII